MEAKTKLGKDVLEQIAERQVTIDVFTRFYTFIFSNSEGHAMKDPKIKAEEFLRTYIPSWEKEGAKEGLEPLDLDWKGERERFIEDIKEEIERITSVTNEDVEKYIRIAQQAQEINK